MLADFADLSSGYSVADDRPLRFASQYGSLGSPTDSEPTSDGEQYPERIDQWLFFSGLARAVIVAFTSKARQEHLDRL